MEFREKFSHFRAMALQLAGIRQGGFFVPYPYAPSIPRQAPPYEAVEALFESQLARIDALLAEFAQTFPDFRRGIESGAIPWEDSGMFPYLDAIAAYGLLRLIKPQRVLEIGSGASSHVMARALADNGQGKLTCLDPVPRRSIQDLGVSMIPRVLDAADVALLADFEANDVLFIDSSHVMLPRMDVDIQFNRMFPALPSGVVVHVHDIFLPDDYPQGWAGRHFSEQNALIGWIASGYFEVVFPGYYLATRQAQLLSRHLGDLMPKVPARNAGSIWLRKT